MVQILRSIAVFCWLAFASEASSSATTSLPSSTTSSAAVQTIDVGESGLTFDPDTLTVSPGGKVEFHFYPGNHSVVQASFANPCHPLSETSFFSGFVPDQSTIFTLMINDTNPIWYYCGQVGHCQAGMVGVINPPANSPDTLEVFKTSAVTSNGSTVPASVEGGVLGPPNSGTSTSSAVASSTSASSTSASSTSTSSPSQTGEATVLFPWTDMGIILLLSVLVALWMI
ncbi:uncharacterized protein TRUGW13939_06784 [Talaromyces rugulosus]|uniref:Phytocyanin domain-containing protein n=1 Tax=Talaromyces rugulosus TaxID=121627 RepID=A0A7H8R080_TALRU|nr:uncharacterized protein TRUGW13939_06784 [Talaromyces rugulosus]QKX59647.1 hypothetical protein TRUGW13939_06784 [Talaromyces rugulosus]